MRSWHSAPGIALQSAGGGDGGGRAELQKRRISSISTSDGLTNRGSSWGASSARHARTGSPVRSSASQVERDARVRLARLRRGRAALARRAREPERQALLVPLREEAREEAKHYGVAEVARKLLRRGHGARMARVVFPALRCPLRSPPLVRAPRARLVAVHEGVRSQAEISVSSAEISARLREALYVRLTQAHEQVCANYGSKAIETTCTGPAARQESCQAEGARDGAAGTEDDVVREKPGARRPGRRARGAGRCWGRARVCAEPHANTCTVPYVVQKAGEQTIHKETLSQTRISC